MTSKKGGPRNGVTEVGLAMTCIEAGVTCEMVS